MRVLMLVWTDVAHDARVQREAAALAAAGHQVHVIGRAVDETWQPPPGVSISSAGQPPASQGRTRRLPTPLLPLRWLLLPTHVSRRHRRWVAAAVVDGSRRDFDVVHAHDFTALELGVHLARQRRVPLVYDAHEFWPGRERQGRPTPLRHARERRAEQRGGDQAVLVVTIGAELAELLRHRYGWDAVVVRNSFPDSEGDPPVVPSAVAYGGRIGAGRDLETVCRAAPSIRPFRTVLFGPVDGGYLARLPIADVDVEPAVSSEESVLRVRQAGIALVPLEDGWPNHRVALPNKLFMAVAAGVPVVAADLPALRRLVLDHDLGALYRPGDVSSFVMAVNDVRTHYDKYLAAVRRARKTLGWQRDSAVLTAAYDAMSADLAVTLTTR
jgi:glycogen(starch) synthase